MTDLLFVYGTLLENGNPFADYLRRNCTYVSIGMIKGTLYDIGEYPGVVINKKAQNYVHGSIYKLHNPQDDISIIDDYEGFGPQQIQPNLYTRIITAIETPLGVFDAWIYQYNLSINGLAVISSGDYAKYIKQKIPQ